MTGGFTKRAGAFIWASLVRPRDLFRWMRFRATKDRAFDHCIPWMTWGAIDFLEKNTKSGLKVKEWGAGGSTLFFLKRGCSVTSIENNETWKQFVETRAASMKLEQNLDLRFVQANRQDRESLNRYVHAIKDGGPWDVIIVDGIPETRGDCIVEAMHNVTPNGMLVLDDSYWEQFAEVPSILKGWRRSKFRGLGPERRGVSQTDIYIRPPSDRKTH